MVIDYKKLEENLPKLTSEDFVAAENAICAGGNVLIDARYNSEIQLRLAAKALDVPYPELKTLPLKDFMELKRVVMTYFFVMDSETPTQ